MLKFKIKKELNIHELYFLFEDLIKASDSITTKHYYKKLFEFIKEYYNDELIQNIKDVINKKYVILLLNEDNKFNINQDYFTNYILTNKYGTNILNEKQIYDINIGTINFEKITLCPSLFWKYIFLKKTLFNLNIEHFSIYDIWDNKLLTTKIKNPNDYLLLVQFVNFYNKLELFYNYKYYDINIDNHFKFLDKPLLSVYDTNINNISFINISPLDYNLKLLNIKNEHFINIINKNFPTNIITNFYKTFNIFKDFEKALPKEYYNKLLQLYKQEEEFNKAYLQNKCEHYKLLKNNQIEDIINLYIDKKNNNLSNLETKNNFFQCTKCKFNLICPHVVFKFMNKNKNLNAFIELFENRENVAFCKICGEKLYNTSFGFDTPKKSDILLTFEGLSEPQDILKKNIFVESSIIINNFITKNKYIYNDDIFKFVYDHVYDKLFDIITIIHKDKTSSNYTKSIKFQLLIYIYCLCSIATIATTYPTYLKLFNNKTSQIKNLIPLIIENIMQIKNNIINKLNFTQGHIQNLVSEVLNKLINNLPKFVSLKDVSINAFILNDIYENVFYNYVFIINKILYGINFDIEIVLNINLNDIVLNKNNIFLPNYNFLKTKKGGRVKEMKPQFTAKDISNLSKKLIKDFTNDKIVNDYLYTNPLFIELKQNIEFIDIDETPIINSIIVYSNLNNYHSMYNILYNKPNYEIDEYILIKPTYDYLKNIKNQVLITDDDKIKPTNNIKIIKGITKINPSKNNYDYNNSEIISKIIKDLNIIKNNYKDENTPTHLKKIIFPQIDIDKITQDYNLNSIIEKIEKIPQLKEYYKYITEYIKNNINLFTPVKDLLPLFKLISVTSSDEGIISKSSTRDIAVEEEISIQVDMDNDIGMGDDWDPEDDTNLHDRE
jgi:hypothetical protein